MKTINKARILFSAVSVILVSVIVTFLVFSKPTYADVNINPTAKKWVTAMYYNCLKGGHYAETISKDNQYPIEAISNSGEVFSQPLPSLEYFKGADTSLTCGMALAGDDRATGDEVSGVVQMMGIEERPETMTWLGIAASPVPDLIDRLGYSPAQNNGELTFTYNSRVEGRDAVTYHYTSAIRASNGKYEVARNDIDGLSLDISGNKLTINFTKKRNPYNICQQTGGLNNVEIDLTSNVNQTFDRIKNAFGLGSIITETCNNKSGSVDAGTPTYYYITSGNSATDYSLGSNKEQTAKESIRKMGYPGVGNLSLEDPDDSELYNLYAYYLQNSTNNLGTILSCDPKDGYGEIHLKSGGKWYKYYINSSTVTKNARKFVTLNVSGDNVSFGDISLEDIVNWLNTHGAGAPDASSAGCPAPDTIGQIDATVQTDGEQSCFDNAESLGWVVCPIIKGVAAAVDGLYSKIVEPLLEINVSAFNQDNDAYKAWQYFQSIANIIFVILFLVVIISQITGVGIDNLGIKRILPKLIVAAILVNLSYIICMALVDVSNIVGYGLKTVFDSFVSNGGNSAYEGQNAVNGLLSLLGLGGGVAIAVVTAPLWSAAMIPALLLGLISILIGIITMFVLLGVYQAGVIAAVVVSPIAFVLYMLPNTKSIFDRWRKIFQGLLLLYPLCGLVIGLGSFIGKIIQNVSDGFFMSLLGALMSVIPFFFIPKLLKASMNAMGNIGAKISGIGKGLSGKTQGAISNSEAFQQWQRNRAAGVNSRGESTLRGNLMRKIAGGNGSLARSTKRKLMRAEASWLKNEKELGNYDPDGLQTRIQAMDKDLEESQVLTAVSSLKNGEDFKSGNFVKMGKDLATLLENDKNGENAVQIKAYTDALNSVGEDGRQAMSDAFEDAGIDFAKISQQGRQAFARNIMEKHGADFKNNHRSLFELAKENNGAVGSGKFSDYAPGGSKAAGVDSYKAEQYANMDDGEFDRIEAQYQSLLAQRDAATDEVERKRLNEQIASMQELAHEAVSNENIIGSAKKKRVKKLEAMASGHNPSSNTPSSGIATATPNPNRAQPNQSFNVRNSSSGTQSSIVTPDTKEYNQAVDNLKKNNS